MGVLLIFTLKNISLVLCDQGLNISENGANCGCFVRNVKRSFDLLYAFLALLFQAEAEDFVPIFVRVDAGRVAHDTF